MNQSKEEYHVDKQCNYISIHLTNQETFWHVPIVHAETQTAQLNDLM